MTLQNLREGKTTKFDSIIKPVKAYFEEQYEELLKDNAKLIDGYIMSEIRKEIEENKGILCFISDNDQLIIDSNILNKKNLVRISSLKTGSFSLYFRYLEENKKAIDNVKIDCWGYSITDTSLNNLYYIDDEKALIKFYKEELVRIEKENQAEELKHLKDRQQKETERRIKEDKLLNDTIRFGLEEVDKNIISKLIAIEELGLGGERDPKETLKLIEAIGLGSGALTEEMRDEVRDIAYDEARSLLSDHEYNEH